MKKLILLILFLLTLTTLRAPEDNVLYIEKATPVDPYKKLVDAITWVESMNGKYIWNPIEKAVGPFQIRPIRVEDYNKRTGNKYKLEDFYNYDLSRKMFLYYAKGKTYEQAAKSWNGSGPKTIKYWAKVKQRLNEANSSV